MKILNSEVKMCLICMEEHEVQTVKLEETTVFKGEEVDFEAIYEYCCQANEYLENEEQIRSNDLAMKDAYRKKVGLLTSQEIVAIRERYGVSQKDFVKILCWGGATITRYENHQIQTLVHDDVLRNIRSDPKWFLEMLDRSKQSISKRAFN